MSRGMWTKVGSITALAVTLVLLGSLLSFSTASADKGATVGIESFSAGPDETAKVNLWADGLTEPGLAAWTIDVHYNPEYLTPGDCAAEHGGICNAAYGENVVRVVGTDVEGITGETVLGSLQFSCKKIGESGLELKLDVFADATPGGPQEIATKIDGGKALCMEAHEKLPGDVDCDEDIDTIDAVLVLQYIAQLTDDLKCLKNADANGDEHIDALDAMYILQIVAGFID